MLDDRLSGVAVKSFRSTTMFSLPPLTTTLRRHTTHHFLLTLSPLLSGYTIIADSTQYPVSIPRSQQNPNMLASDRATSWDDIAKEVLDFCIVRQP